MLITFVGGQAYNGIGYRHCVIVIMCIVIRETSRLSSTKWLTRIMNAVLCRGIFMHAII